MTLRSAALVGSVLGLALPAAAQAHPQAERSIPAADAVLETSPTSVTITFTEPVEAVGDGIRVIGPSGAEVARGTTRQTRTTLERGVDATEQGSYLVRWQVIGDDSHPARGAFLFSVGQPTRAGVPGEGQSGMALQAAARWVSVGGLALGFGVPFVVLVALAGTMTPARWRLVHVGIALMLLAEPIGLLGQTATLAPSDPFDSELAGDVLRTSYGHDAALRAGVALGLWALAGAARQTGRRGLAAISVLGAVGCLVQAASLHRIESVPDALGLVLGACHVGGVVVWLAAILLAVLGAPATSLAQTAGAALLVAIVTGSGLGLAHLASPADLVQTSYGVVLVVKLATLAGAILLAAIATRRPGARSAELVVGSAVLAFGAALATLVPPL